MTLLIARADGSPWGRLRRRAILGTALLVLVVVALVGCNTGDNEASKVGSVSPSGPASSPTKPPSHGWAIGDNGTIVATTNGGATWHVQRANKLDDLSAIDFADSSHGWAVGDLADKKPWMNGIILTTSDGGTTWRWRSVKGAGSLSGVDFVDARHGWVVGLDRLIMATSDGGETWIKQAAPEVVAVGYDLNAVKFLDAQHGWAVGGTNTGGYGVILVTADGGTTWTAQQFDESGREVALDSIFYAIALNSPSQGSAVGWANYATTNGGANWHKIGPKTSWGSDATLAADGRGFVIGGTEPRIQRYVPGLLVTTDGGTTWRTRAIPEPLKSAGWFGSVFFSDADHGWLVGGDGHGGPRVAVTADGGATWKRQHIDGDFELHDVTFNDAPPQAAD